MKVLFLFQFILPRKTTTKMAMPDTKKCVATTFCLMAFILMVLCQMLAKYPTICFERPQ
jgi:hypothetical protein